MITIRKMVPSDYDFICDCIKNNYTVNDFEKPIDGETLQDYLGTDQIFIVHKSNKDLGFFTQDLDVVNMHIGATCWQHPKACKMTVVDITSAATVRGMHYAVAHDYKYCEFNVWHPLLVRTARKLLPELRETKFYDTYRILFCSIQELIDGRGYKNVMGFEYEDMNEKDLTFSYSEY